MQVNSSRQQWDSTSWLMRHGRRDQYIENEERMEMLRRTIDAIHDTPLHMTEFDGSYIRDFDGEMVMRVLNDCH
jgi:uncharacterized damage-inducible protein DinB